MEITQIRVFLVDEEKLKAFVSIVFDDCFAVSDIKVIQGNHGLFVSMPSKRRKNGTFRDIAHPLNNETRRMVEEGIIGEYRRVIADSGGDTDVPLRDLDDVRTRGDGGEELAGRDTVGDPDFLKPPYENSGG
jgi:stage V sporulation protein G